MSLLMDIQTNRYWARVDFLATGEIVLHIPEECELPIRVLVSRGGRSTEYEPKSSEKPNNCETCRFELYCPEMCEGCCEWDSHYEPKDEPQTCSFSDCDNFKNPDYERCIECKRKQIKLKTEPTISKMEQVEDETRLTAKCLNCANGSSYKCSKCDGEMYFTRLEPKDEPQIENPCDGCVCDDGKHLMYCMNCKGIAWQTEPPKIEDEPQTDYTPDCPFCKRYGTEDCLGSDCRHYKTYKTEPQTERSE